MIAFLTLWGNPVAADEPIHFTVSVSTERLEPGTMDSLKQAGLVTIDYEAGVMTFGDEPLMQAGEITSPAAWDDCYAEVTSKEWFVLVKAAETAAVNAGADEEVAETWASEQFGSQPICQ